jgi:predicted amidohydrolase
VSWTVFPISRRSNLAFSPLYTRAVTFLAAVQTKLELDAYRTSAAFSDWILSQTRQALLERDPSEPALVAFPEMIGLPLLLFLERTTNAENVRDAALGLFRERWLDALRLGLKHRNFGLSSLVLPRALPVFDAYTTAFSKAARATNSFIVGGSVLLPGIELEAAKGLHISDGRVQNVSYTFSPTGNILARTGKINLTGGLESALGLSSMSLNAWHTAQTPFGKIGTLICYDAFFERLLERADAMGAQILVQPSANAAVWDGPWSADATLLEGQEWLARGPVTRVQGRTNTRYVLNPMLVGRLLELEFQGKSSIAVNRFLEPEGVTAMAQSAMDFEIVTTRIS